MNLYSGFSDKNVFVHIAFSEVDSEVGIWRVDVCIGDLKVVVVRTRG